MATIDTIEEQLHRDLLGFWDSQLRIRRVENSLHVAYPLLHPNGWQISFTVEVEQAPTQHFRLTDNGQTLRWLEDAGVTGKKAHDYLQERCTFFGLALDGYELTRTTFRFFSATEIELFAEGLQAIAYLYFRAEPQIQREGVVRNAFETLLQKSRLKKCPYNSLSGQLIPQIHFDYVIEDDDLTACKLFERKTELRQSLEIWGFRFYDLHEADPDVKRLIVYNPDVGRWDNETVQLAEGICDAFIPFNDGKRIKNFLKAA